MIRISATSAASIAKFVEAITDKKLFRAVVVAPGLVSAFDEIAPRPGGWAGSTFAELVAEFERLAGSGEIDIARDFLLPLNVASDAVTKALDK